MEKSKRKTSLITVLIATIALVFIVLTAGQLFLITRFSNKSTSKSYAENCSQLAQAYSMMLTNRLNMYLREIRYYVESDVVQTLDTDKIIEWMCSRNEKKSSNIDAMYFCTLDGVAYRDDGTVSNFKNEEFYKAIALDGNYEYISNPKMDEVIKKPIFYVAHVLIVNGKKLGMFAGVYPLSTIQKVVSDIQLGETGNAWLLAGDGTVIIYPENGYAMNKNFLKGLGNSHKDLKEVAENMCKRNIGSAWIKNVSTGKNEYVTYAPVHNTPWSIGFNISESQIYEAGYAIRNIILVSFALIVIILLAVTGFVMFVQLDPLKKVKESIEEISSGNANLTKRITVSANNEIGSIVLGFNRFTDKLQSIISELKKSQETLAGAGEILKTATAESADAIENIKDSIIETTAGINDQSEGISETSAAVNEIASNIESLEKMIANQVAGVTQASSAVEQMIGNIDSVNSTVEKLVASFTLLAASAHDGYQKQSDANEMVMKIEADSKLLLEANQVIANIAQQTNLLAMNAAIEAAHAGEAGKGFSVVADEIRKLSENSTLQSKSIGERLSAIRQSIENVVEASKETSSAFSTVENGIKDTDQLVQSIQSAMAEQKVGSSQIIEALHDMNDSSVEVSSASKEMSEGNSLILSQVERLKASSEKMQNFMNLMDENTKHIDSSSSEMIEISNKVRETINQIGAQIDQFEV
ncbi:MAG: HAMP domain-containing protein [Treponema sp.]|nr:HAMP domain-containing protein [Treponema sp.]